MAGAMILPETRRREAAGRSRPRRAVSAPATRAEGASGEELANFEPGSDVQRQGDRPRRRHAGASDWRSRLDRFGLRGASPQVWALGVKEVWKVAKPLERVIHTMGWPLRNGAKYREFGGSFIYPMGDDMLTIGMVVGLDHRDVELSVHDLLQELKTHPLVPEAPRRRRAGRPGARRRSPRAASCRCRSGCTRRGC